MSISGSNPALVRHLSILEFIAHHRPLSKVFAFAETKMKRNSSTLALCEKVCCLLLYVSDDVNAFSWLGSQFVLSYLLFSAPATVSVGSSGASRPSTPLSSNSSVVPSPSMEVRSLGQQPIISSQLVQPTIQSAPTSNSVMTATVIPQVTPAPTSLDRIWQTVSQVAGHSDPIPLPNPLVGLQLPTVPGATLAGMTGLMPNSTYSSISPSTQPPTTTATTTTTTLFGIPGDAPNLLTTYLVALLSGQSQVTLPTPQPVRHVFPHGKRGLGVLLFLRLVVFYR